MRAFMVGLIVLALCAATFADDAGWVEMSSKASKGWAWTASAGLIYAAWWFWSEDR